MRLRAMQDNLMGYFFIGPFVFGFLLFTLIPIVSSLYLSFTDYDLFAKAEWVGLANYEHLFFTDSKYWQSVKVTFIYVIGGVPLRLAFALMIAMLLNTTARAIGIYRTVFYLPSIIGGSVAVAIMWRYLFGDDGVVNAAIGLVGIDAIRWFGNPLAALWMLIFLSVWQFGSSMLIFLAGLKNIPASYYEAASVDGANAIQKFIKITLPMLSPVILFNAIMQTIAAFMTFIPAFIISSGTGGPLDGTLLYSLYLFRKGFEFFHMGEASAMAWIMLLIVAALTAILFMSSKFWVHYESKGGN